MLLCYSLFARVRSASQKNTQYYGRLQYDFIANDFMMEYVQQLMFMEKHKRVQKYFDRQSLSSTFIKDYGNKRCEKFPYKQSIGNIGLVFQKCDTDIPVQYNLV